MTGADQLAQAKALRLRLAAALAATVAGWAVVGGLQLGFTAAVAVMAVPSMALLWFVWQAAHGIYGTGLALGMLLVALFLHREGAWWAIPGLALYLAWRLSAAVSRGSRTEDVGPSV